MDFLDECEMNMMKAIDNLEARLITVRAGRANASMLNGIMVEYYGAPTPINQVANITVPEARQLFIKPFDRSIIKDIERAILKSDLGLNPSNDGSVIRLIIPELTEETRKNLVKTVKKYGEESKVAVRSIRRDANEKIKALKKEADISEDEIKKGEEDVQKVTDIYIKDIDAKILAKEKEIMSV